MLTAAIFLDRDGVVIEDCHLPDAREKIRVFPEAADFIAAVRKLGFKVFLVTNQTVVSRGMMSLSQANALNSYVLDELLKRDPGARIDDVRLCPHHPNAQVVEYRQDCECRKPRPGMIVDLARKHQIELKNSFMLGDRRSDVIAGNLAGCRSILLRTGQHEKPLIESSLSIPPEAQQEAFAADSLSGALDWIQGVMK